MNKAPSSRPMSPQQTDPEALLRFRLRAQQAGFVDFLHEIAADEAKDRLDEINRSFPVQTIVTDFTAFWQRAFPQARLIAAGSVLDLQPQSCDLILHAMSLHWADDPVGQIIQAAHALRPDGLFMAVCFGGQSLHELRAALAQAEAELSGGLSPRVLPMGEIRDLGGLLSRAGLALPVADLVSQRVSYRDLYHLAHDLRAMGEANALASRSRHPTRRALFERAARIYAENFPDHDRPGRIMASFDLVFLTGWSPSETQQKPLRRGSAAISLADALQQTRKTS